MDQPPLYPAVVQSQPPYAPGYSYPGEYSAPPPSQVYQQQPYAIPQQQAQAYSIPQQQPAPTYVIMPSKDRNGIGMLFFCLGWCFTPLWWVGACFPSKLPPSAVSARSWQRANQVMTALSIVAIIAIIVIIACFPDKIRQGYNDIVN